MINFERYLKELLFEDDFIIIPGLGAFIAQFTKPEMLESGEITTAKKTFEFNSFLNVDEDQKLVKAITHKEGISKSAIEADLNEFLFRLKSSLNTNKKVTLGDFCSFTRNEDGSLHGQFDTSINFLEKPDFAIASDSKPLYTLNEIKNEEERISPKKVEESIEPTITEQAATPIIYPEEIEEIPFANEEDTEEYFEEQEYQKSGGNKLLYYLIPILIALGVLAYLWYQGNNEVKEEIIVNADNEEIPYIINDTIPFNDSSMVDETEVIYEDENSITREIESEPVAPEVKPKIETESTSKSYRYEVAAGLFRSTDNAIKLQRKLKSAGFKSEIKLINGLRRVYVGVNTQEEAEQMSKKIEQFTGEKSVYFDENGISNR